MSILVQAFFLGLHCLRILIHALGLLGAGILLLWALS